MKNLSIIFILLIPILTLGQKTKGTFCKSSTLVGECITFNIDNQFEYNHWSCFGALQGMGNYQITKDSLLLWFEQKVPNNHFTIKHSEESLNDSIIIEVQTYYETTEPLPYAKLVIALTKSPDSLNTLYSQSTDINGKATFKIPKTQQEIWLTCSFVGAKPTFIKLELGKDYQLIGHIYFGNLLVIENEVLRFEIKALKKKQTGFEINV